jgi:RimJ/RimL family protein N-acetyltransferase
VADARIVEVASLPDCLHAGPLELHRWSIDRADALTAAVTASFPELRQWMEWAQTMPTREALTGFIERCIASFDDDRQWEYCLEEAQTGELVGGAGLLPRSGPQALEIGYWVRTDRCGRGYATEAAHRLAAAAFAAPPGIERVSICMDRGNLASAAVPRKLGFGLVSEPEREIVTPGQTGRGQVWTMERSEWDLRLDAMGPTP